MNAKQSARQDGSEDNQLGPCPKCRKGEGKIHDAGSGRFRYFVMCEACAWSTEASRIKSVAAKLWNEAKPAPKQSQQNAR